MYSVVARYAVAGIVHTIDATASHEARAAAAARAAYPSQLVVALGPPGSGVATQCALLASEFGFTRCHRTPCCVQRRGVAPHAVTPSALPWQTASRLLTPFTMELLVAAIVAAPSRKILLQGFPLTLAQMEALHAAVGPPTSVLVFDVAAATSRARLAPKGKVAPHAADAPPLRLTRASRLSQLTRHPLWRRTAPQAAVSRVLWTLPPVQTSCLRHTAARSSRRWRAWRAPWVRRRGSAVAAGLRLGYATLKVTALLRAEVTRGSAAGGRIAEAFAANRTAPTTPLRLSSTLPWCAAAVRACCSMASPAPCLWGTLPCMTKHSGPGQVGVCSGVHRSGGCHAHASCTCRCNNARPDRCRRGARADVPA